MYLPGNICLKKKMNKFKTNEFSENLIKTFRLL